MCVAYFYNDNVQTWPSNIDEAVIIIRAGVDTTLTKSAEIGALVTQDDGWMTIEGMPGVMGGPDFSDF